MQPAFLNRPLTLSLNVPEHSFRTILIAAVFACGAWAIWTLPDGLGLDGRKVLLITYAAVLGWVATRLPESLVAIAAALALVFWDVMPEERLFATLGSELVWLLLAAFVIAAVLKESGVVMRLIAPLIASGLTVSSLFSILTLLISATAFLLPSTSARAALLLPIYSALIPLLPARPVALGLALLFPSVILLSACSSLIGAGAHIVAIDAIAGATGLHLGYLDWLLLGAPIGFLASGITALLILWLFVPRNLWRARLRIAQDPKQINLRQACILFVLVGLIGLWMTEALHGLSTALVALAGTLVLLLPSFIDKKSKKEVFRAVDSELLVYLAATMLIAQAMISSGTDQWLATGALEILPEGIARHSTGIALGLSVIAVAAHLAITSRSARAAVLIPAVALPVAGLGHDAALTVLIVTMGTGFCQTMMASAKPVAIYGNHEGGGFSQADLLKLAAPLAPIKILLLIFFASWVWPGQLDQLRTTLPAEPPAKSYMHVGIDADTDELFATETVIAPLTSLRPVARPQPKGVQNPGKR